MTLTSLFHSVSRRLSDAQAVILLGLVFFVLIVPIGLTRRLLKAFAARSGKSAADGAGTYFIMRSDEKELVERMERPF